MNVRHLATKSFDKGVSYRQNLVTKDGIHISYDICKTDTKKISYSEQLVLGTDFLRKSDLGKFTLDEEFNVLPMSALYNNTEYSDAFKGSFSELKELACKMFNNRNPITNKTDVNPNSYYTPYIPLVIMTGCMTPQLNGNEVFFNPEGSVSIAEFLDGLNAIKYGSNSNRNRVKTMDCISDESDYFNEGYNGCICGMSSPFFGLYKREELINPITRAELAYIVVMCWEQFKINKNQYRLGASFDWENPKGLLDKFEDGYDYNISKFLLDDDYSVASLNIKDYMNGLTMSEYKDSIMDGKHCIAMPMFMSLLELVNLGIFFKDNKLNPLKEISREELGYFLTKLAELFPMK